MSDELQVNIGSNVRLNLHNKFLRRNFHALLNGDEATSMDVLFYVESLRTKHHLKEKPFYSLFQEVLKYRDTLENDGVPCSKTIRNRLQKKLVGVTLSFEYRNQETGRIKKFNNLDSIPRKKYNRKKWQLVYTVAKVSHA